MTAEAAPRTTAPARATGTRRKQPAAAVPSPEPDTTWVLQAEAAARTGYSVSAIRKWRRTGLVADRKRTTAGGMERVEVRLEDVQARLAEQPPERPRPPAPVPDGGPPPGTAIVPIADLEALFDRARSAERRADQAEARLQAAEVEARFMSGQLAELRRQVQAAGAEAVAAAARPLVEERRPAPATEPVARAAAPAPVAAPAAAPAPAPAPAPAGPSGTNLRRAFDRLTLDRGAVELLGLDLARDRAAPSPTAPSTATPPPVRSTAAPAAARSAPFDGREPGGERGQKPTTASRQAAVDSLASELRRLYARLDGYRREPTISRARERQRERDLGDYDTVLLRACSTVGVPTGLRVGEPVGIERRAALTKALARAGIDVRTGADAVSSRD